MGMTHQEQLREAIAGMEECIRMYREQEKIFMKCLETAGLAEAFAAFCLKNAAAADRTQLSLMTPDAASISLIDGEVHISYVNEHDYNHYYLISVDVGEEKMSAIYSTGDSPQAKYVALDRVETCKVLRDIGHAMGAEEMRIARAQELVEKTMGLVFAERYAVMLQGAKGITDAEAQEPFFSFLHGLSGDGGMAMEFLDELEKSLASSAATAYWQDRKRFGTSGDADSGPGDAMPDTERLLRDLGKLREDIRRHVEEPKTQKERRTELPKQYII